MLKNKSSSYVLVICAALLSVSIHAGGKGNRATSPTQRPITADALVAAGIELEYCSALPLNGKRHERKPHAAKRQRPRTHQEELFQEKP